MNTQRSGTEAGTPARPTYRPDIDGLRAIAVGAVVAYHTGIPGVRGGFTGVDVFFVISGYLITGLLLLDIKQYRRVRILQFYARRVRRILPMLLLVVLATELASILLLSPALRETQRISHEAIATLLVSANFFFLRAGENYFSVRSDFEPLLHTWSLAVEEQFYLVWPAILAVAYVISARTRSPGFWLGVMMGVLCLGSFACALILSRWREDWTFYLTAARGWELGAGGLLAITLPSVRGFRKSWALTASVVGLGLIVAGIVFVPAEHSSPLLLFVFPVLGTCLVIGGNTLLPSGHSSGHPPGPVGWLLSRDALVQIGLVSYGWYLWHWPALSLVRILGLGSHDLVRDCAISVSTLALSFGTLRWFERPLRSGAGIRAVPSGWVVMTGCGATIAAVMLVFGVNAWSDHKLRTAAEIALFQAKDDGDTKCLLSLGSAETVAPAGCLVSGDLPRVVLWGDSIADRFAPAMHDWATRQGTPVAIEELTKSACPPVLNLLPTEPLAGTWKPYDGCRSFNDWAANRLPLASSNGSTGVMIAANWWLRGTDFDLRRLDRPEPRMSFDLSATTTATSLSALESGMRSTLRDITGQGLRAVIVLQTPMLISPWGGGLLDAPDCLFRKHERECAMSLAVHRQLTDPVNQVLINVAREFPNVRIFDPIPLLCFDGECPARVNGIVAYTDSVHFSATMSRTMTDALTPYLDWLTAPRPQVSR